LTTVVLAAEGEEMMILVLEKRTEEVEPKCIPVTPASVTGGV
jgi:hypothetical protein